MSCVLPVCTYKLKNDVGDVLHHGTFSLSALQSGQKLGAYLPHFLHVGEDDMVLPFVQHSPSLRQVGVHARVIHKVLNQYIQTAEVGRL